MRRLLLPVLLLLAAACGSSSTGVTTPPPPVGSGLPASIVIQAGDGQQAEPGVAVGTKPSVLVKDSAGQPLAGVIVTFSVDSGGGSLSTATATTGSNGVASAGTWTLGSAEGRNTIKVTVGSLAPVKIAATAVIVGASFPTTTIGSGGGSITVTQAGPLNGFSLTVPGGAFASSLVATVSYASNTSMLAKMAVNPVGPVIRISTATTAYAVAPITVHVSVAIPPNTFPVIRMYDPATGANESMAPVSWDANGVTGKTGHLNSANFLPLIGGGAGGRRASLSDPGVTIIVDAVPTVLLQQDYDSGYRPGADDWEFGVTATANGQLPVSAEGPTSLWYFLTKQGPQKLNGRFLQAAGVPFSDRPGLRWIATLDQGFKVDMVNAVGAAIGGNSNAQSDQNQFNLIRANFVRDVQAGLPPRPQLVTITNSTGVPLTVVAYRVHGTQLFIYNPTAPGDATQYLEFLTGSAMTPIHLPIFTLSTFDSPLASGATLFLPISQLPTTYAQVLDGTIGNGLFPTYELHGWAGRLYDTMYVVDTLRWWLHCASCQYGFTSSLFAPPPGTTLAGEDVYAANSATSLGYYYSVLASTSPVAGTDLTLNGVMWSALTADGSVRGWLDWHPYVLRRLQTSISPASPVQTPGAALSLTFQVAQNLLPPHVKYTWDFGDQQGIVTVVDNPVTQHTYAAVGNYPITAQIVDVRNNQVIGRSTASASILNPKPIWRFTAFQLQSETGPPPTTAQDLTVFNQDKAITDQLVNGPTDGFVVLQTINVASVPPQTGHTISLMVAPAGTGGSVTAYNGQLPGASLAVDWFTSQCASQSSCPWFTFNSTGSLTSGTLSGTGVGSGAPLPVSAGVWRTWGITANENGVVLSGTITHTQMILNAAQTAFVGAHTYVWTFSATSIP